MGLSLATTKERMGKGIGEDIASALTKYAVTNRTIPGNCLALDKNFRMVERAGTPHELDIKLRRSGKGSLDNYYLADPRDFEQRGCCYTNME
ncbi:hypothetical protein HYV84_02635 [Candidatus Woesearchaeota archaeon]|nr:hypothetical protein [Candidatus Woesearchaeota archaeon]